MQARGWFLVPDEDSDDNLLFYFLSAVVDAVLMLLGVAYASLSIPRCKAYLVAARLTGRLHRTTFGTLFVVPQLRVSQAQWQLKCYIAVVDLVLTNRCLLCVRALQCVSLGRSEGHVPRR